MDFALLDHMVPALRADLPRRHPTAHHGYSMRRSSRSTTGRCCVQQRTSGPACTGGQRLEGFPVLRKGIVMETAQPVK
ncbi:hypothetical protein [Acidovorax sp. Leaf78]|jgi:hypothetical protein|uniref:hypothetical protein n=1 Tax=Acidovorax sp. Leaf78 TaxID=1736237 RepID=UPI0006F369A8|nr:hypothetical protein ASF16_25005 [Acidovorax sp. Leaf78]